MGSSGSDHRPLIGVTTYIEDARYGAWETRSAVLPQVYFDAILRAGGVPVLIPPVGDGHRELVRRFDGLVLSGGADVDPGLYGHEPHERTRNTRPDRDAFELSLLEQARAAELPIFAVCRGMQLLNVALGGTLVQHLPDTLGHDEHLPTPGVYGSQTVETLDGSKVAQIVGAEVTVRCHHHQAIDILGAGLRATAWSTNGVIEAVENDDETYLLGVQWHPEEDVTDTRLFAALVDAARQRL
ncbi:gamma-glutamyl-gamma-aminobutyrate hydrolase family protein [Antrihabitans stalactiti]|uniref:gamma-glutamyl-gamma-aminobutyrate hydrolase family protein n=1 Tax=Antrihabitans stalactiti TaxID=2584121 RepID=UPI0030B80764